MGSDDTKPTIEDQTGRQVRSTCKDGCRKAGTGTLKRSDRFTVQPMPGAQRQRYAGHIANCDKCGREWTDFYNWSPQ